MKHPHVRIRGFLLAPLLRYQLCRGGDNVRPHMPRGHTNDQPSGLSVREDHQPWVKDDLDGYQLWDKTAYNIAYGEENVAARRHSQREYNCP